MERCAAAQRSQVALQSVQKASNNLKTSNGACESKKSKTVTKKLDDGLKERIKIKEEDRIEELVFETCRRRWKQQPLLEKYTFMAAATA